MNVDKLKSLVGAKGGLARPNQFVVHFPTLGSANMSDMNILCQSAQFPDRQIVTQERLIGIKGRKMPTGFVQDDVTFTFLLLNDYGARRHIEEWMGKVINQDTYEIGYTTDYIEDVHIIQLRKGVSFPVFQRNLPNLRLPSNVQNRLPKVGALDFAQGEFDLDVIYRQDQKMYECVLRDAFPTSLSAIELNNELDGLIQVSVQLSYRTWEAI